WINDWLAEQPYTRNWSRWLTVRTSRQGCRDGEPPKVILSPAPGSHFMWWKGYFMFVNRERKEKENGAGSTTMMTVPRESFTISLFTPFRRTQAITDLLHEARRVS